MHVGDEVIPCKRIFNRRENCGGDNTVALIRTSAWNVDVRSDTTSTQSRAQHFNVQDRSVGSRTVESYLPSFENRRLASVPSSLGRRQICHDQGERGMGGVKGM